MSSSPAGSSALPPLPAHHRALSPVDAARAVFGPVWPLLRRAWVFAVLAGLLVLAPTAYMFEVYGRVVNSRNPTTLLMLSLLLLLALAVMECIEWAKQESLREAASEVDKGLAPRLFASLFEAYERGVAAPSALPVQEWRSVREFVHSPAVGAALEAPVALVFLVLMFLISPVLGWAALAGAVLQVLLAWLNQRRTGLPLREAGKAAGAAQAYAEGALRNAQVMHAMGMLAPALGRWSEKQQQFVQAQAQASDSAGGFQALTKFVQTTISSMLLGLGAWLLLENRLPGGAGMMIVASTLGGRLLAPLVVVVTHWRTVQQAGTAWQNLTQWLNKVPQRPATMPLPRPQGLLSVEALTAGVPSAVSGTPGENGPGLGAPAPVLRGLQFVVRPGEVLAVVGPSASGKTTLARLLVGLWPATAGKVRLDGADVHTWDKAELGPYLGYLPQAVELLEGTLGENVTRFGRPDPQRLEAAVQAAGLQDLLAQLPQGFDTPVGREGAHLSGGQRQRVALARALYGQPALVVLDEPNANLDEAGERALVEAMVRMKQRGTTFVVMTHRTGVLAVADKLLVLADGAQQAFGPRDEVLAALNKAAAQVRQQRQAAAAPRGGESASSHQGQSSQEGGV